MGQGKFLFKNQVFNTENSSDLLLQFSKFDKEIIFMGNRCFTYNFFPLNSTEKLLYGLYAAFHKRDHETMKACYHSDAEFSDPVFTHLKGIQIGAMWHMLCEAGKDLQIQVKHIAVKGDKGECVWEATYTFSATGNNVHNIIYSSFRFKDGLIVWQLDRFNFYRWSGMALGPAGIFLGWLPYLRNKVRKNAARNLAAFMKKHPQYGRE